jgi:hypothetical protein
VNTKPRIEDGLALVDDVIDIWRQVKATDDFTAPTPVILALDAV